MINGEGSFGDSPSVVNQDPASDTPSMSKCGGEFAPQNQPIEGMQINGIQDHRIKVGGSRRCCVACMPVVRAFWTSFVSSRKESLFVLIDRGAAAAVLRALPPQSRVVVASSVHLTKLGA